MPDLTQQESEAIRDYCRTHMLSQARPPRTPIKNVNDLTVDVRKQEPLERQAEMRERQSRS